MTKYRLYEELEQVFDKFPKYHMKILLGDLNAKVGREGWAGHVARMGRRRMLIGYWWKSQKERDHWEHQDVGGWAISKWILENGMGWCRLD
jgi:hypothetical protein